MCLWRWLGYGQQNVINVSLFYVFVEVVGVWSTKRDKCVIVLCVCGGGWGCCGGEGGLRRYYSGTLQL